MIFMFRSPDSLLGIPCKYTYPHWQEELTQYRMNNKLIHCVALTLCSGKNIYDLIFKELLYLVKRKKDGQGSAELLLFTTAGGQEYCLPVPHQQRCHSQERIYKIHANLPFLSKTIFNGRVHVSCISNTDS
jgi:hypothetical protein